MQPYQQASEEYTRQSGLPGQAIKKIAGTAIGIAGGGAVLNRVLPFLNKNIPTELARKGLERIDPRFGKFINGAVNNGQTVEGAMDFIKNKIAPEEEQKSAKQDRNIIEQYSPELFQFLNEHIKKGNTPLQAAGLARLASNSNKFEKIIKKIEEDHKTPWSSIIESVFGTGQTAQPPSQGQQTQQIPQGNNSDAAILEAMGKILKM